MLTWIWTTFGIGVGYLILGFVACVLGGCKIGFGDESWEDERYEKLYYKFLAPTGALSMLCSIVLILVYSALK